MNWPIDVYFLRGETLVEKQLEQYLNKDTKHPTRSVQNLEELHQLSQNKRNKVFICSYSHPVLTQSSLDKFLNKIDFLGSEIILLTNQSQDKLENADLYGLHIIEKSDQTFHLLKETLESIIKKRFILFIEDDRFTQSVLKTYCKKLNLTSAQFVSSFDEAKEFIQASHLIISDYMLGEELATEVFLKDQNTHSPLMLFTASLHKINPKEIQSSDQRIVGVFEKPLSLQNLKSLLNLEL